MSYDVPSEFVERMILLRREVGLEKIVKNSSGVFRFEFKNYTVKKMRVCDGGGLKKAVRLEDGTYEFVFENENDDIDASVFGIRWVEYSSDGVYLISFNNGSVFYIPHVYMESFRNALKSRGIRFDVNAPRL